jgi:hypothetical protein
MTVTAGWTSSLDFGQPERYDFPSSYAYRDMANTFVSHVNHLRYPGQLYQVTIFYDLIVSFVNGDACLPIFGIQIWRYCMAVFSLSMAEVGISIDRGRTESKVTFACPVTKSSYEIHSPAPTRDKNLMSYKHLSLTLHCSYFRRKDPRVRLSEL